MKYLKFLAFLMISFSSLLGMSQEPASDDCPLDFSQFKSRLAVHYDLKLESEIRDVEKKIVVQKGVLDHKVMDLKTGKEVIEKVKVGFEGGGCAHLWFSVTTSQFTAPRLMHRYTKKYLTLAINFATKTLTEVESSIFVEALNKAKQQVSQNERIPKNKSKVIPLECGDARCSLEIINAKEIKLSYDFAL